MISGKRLKRISITMIGMLVITSSLFSFKSPAHAQAEAASPTVISSTDPSITYTGNWGTTDQLGATLRYSETPGSDASFAFEGTALKMVAVRGNNQGKADIYIDGVLNERIDCYGTGYELDTVYQVSGLSVGNHTLKIVVNEEKNPSSTARYIQFASFEYFTEFITDDESVSADIASLNEGTILNGNSSAAFIINNLALPSMGAYGSTIIWDATPSGVIDTITGGVTRENADIPVTLTATVSKGTASQDKIFQLTVKGQNLSDRDYLEEALIHLTDESILKGNSALTDITKDIALPNNLLGTTISWDTDKSGVIDVSTGKVTRSTEQDISLNLTATLTKGAERETKIFTLVVKAISSTAQSGPNPIIFDQTAVIDNLVVLMGGASRHSSNLTVSDFGDPKHSWINNFSATNTDYMEWNVKLDQGGEYHVEMLLDSPKAYNFQLSVENTDHSLDFATKINGWDKLDAGKIFIPSGISKLKLVRTSGSGNINFKSLELIREADRAAYIGRIDEFKVDNTWLSKAKYGLMFQYGPWGYPQTGADKKSIEDQANSFDVDKFVNMVKDTGAEYVIWSMSWWTYEISAPIQSVDDISGNGDRTSKRDLIGEIATALQDKGIRFMLYYHTGQDSHLGYNSTDWWKNQNWPASFAKTGEGDRSTFFNNWEKVVTEVGNRYGSKLDGWFFDDGLVYYPAPFERLGKAARAGNPNRFVSYNSWIAARYTDFQDVYFAEGSHGGVQYGSTPAGGNGVFTDGPQKGLLQQAMFTMEDDWGVHSPNMSITTSVTGNQAISWVKSASNRHVPLTFNMMMWEDGTVSQQSLDVFMTLKKADLSIPPGMVNDDDSNIVYSGSWDVSSGRDSGDFMADVHYTRTKGDYTEFTFKGTGVDYITSTNNDQGNVDVYLDGVFQKTVSANSPTRQVLQTLFQATGLSSRSHTIKLVNASDAFMLVDAFRVTKTVDNGNGNGNGSGNGSGSGNSNSGGSGIGGSEAGGVNGKVKLPNPVVSGKTATVVIDNQTFSRALQQSTVVVIDIPKQNGVSAYAVSFPADALSSSNTKNKVQIITEIGTITVPVNMLKPKDVEGAERVELVISKADMSSIDPSLKAIIGNKPVIDIHLKVNGKRVPWSNSEAPVIVAIPYTLTEAEKASPEHIVIWYIDDAGQVIAMPSGKYDATTGMATFTTTHFSRYAVAFIQKTFEDLGKYTWAKKAIEVLASKGIIKGTSDTSFHPEAEIKRADFIVLLINALGLTAHVTDNFIDVESSSYFYESVGVARKLGIANGVGNQLFNPDVLITRQEMMMLIANAMKVAGKELTAGVASDLNGFTDKANIALYAADHVATLVKNGMVTGDGRYIYPLSHATRAEAAQLMYKVYNK